MAGNPHIDQAGDFRLPSIVLHNHQNNGISNKTLGTDIKHMVQEFNIYEDMFSSAMSGTLVIADSRNLVANLPIQGTERLTFKLETPGARDQREVIDCTDESGHPMHIYKLTNKKQAKDGLQIYTLHFCSRELLRSTRTRVSQAYSGRIDQMVSSIFDDENYLDSKKTLRVQKTRNQDKIVIPNLSPFEAIAMLCTKALADSSTNKSAGYYFWETSKGFQFRSWESLCSDEQGNPRKIKQTFRFMPMNIKDPNITDKISHDYTSVEEYKFTNNFHDVLANTVLGTYGHRVITHNLYDKSYREDSYHYHNSFSDTNHTDGPNPAVVDTPVDFDDKTISDYPESRVSVVPTTRFTHGEDTGSYGIDVTQDGIIDGEQTSQRNQIMSGTRLQMTIKGQSNIEVGDVIQFDLVSVENKVITRARLDPQYSGRYIITKIRHRVTDTDYLQVIECTKDSVAKAFSSHRLKSYPGKKPRNSKAIIKDAFSGNPHNDTFLSKSPSSI